MKTICEKKEIQEDDIAFFERMCSSPFPVSVVNCLSLDFCENLNAFSVQNINRPEFARGKKARKRIMNDFSTHTISLFMRFFGRFEGHIEGENVSFPSPRKR